MYILLRYKKPANRRLFVFQVHPPGLEPGTPRPKRDMISSSPRVLSQYFYIEWMQCTTVLYDIQPAYSSKISFW